MGERKTEYGNADEESRLAQGGRAFADGAARFCPLSLLSLLGFFPFFSLYFPGVDETLHTNQHWEHGAKGVGLSFPRLGCVTVRTCLVTSSPAFTTFRSSPLSLPCHSFQLFREFSLRPFGRPLYYIHLSNEDFPVGGPPCTTTKSKKGGKAGLQGMDTGFGEVRQDLRAAASLGIILASCVWQLCTFTERYPEGGARGRFRGKGGGGVDTF